VRIAVTGATGFVGRHLVVALTAAGHEPIPVSRRGLDDHGTLVGPLRGAEALVHLAALAHRTGRQTPAEAEFDAVNHLLPLRVFRAAEEAGVRRFVQVSTINVVSGNPGVLQPDSPIAPTTAYGRAKARAERDLRSLARAEAPELVILRPPLVYGAEAKGNFRSLLRLCATSLPLPFGSVENRRSFIGVGNLVDAIIFLATFTGALPSPVFHVTDGRDMSLRELVTTLRHHLGRPARLFRCPPQALRTAMTVAGRRTQASQLLDDLRIDASRLQALGWTAPNSPDADLARMAQDYLRGTRVGRA
jgi:UDP-glucose 4-epimerase